MRLSYAVLPIVLAVLAAPDEEIVRDFKKYFRKYKDTPTRVEAILALEDAQSPGVVDVLIPVLRDDDPKIVQAVVRVLGGLSAPKAVESLLKKLASERKDEVVAGLLDAVELGAYPGAGPSIIPWLSHTDWNLRRKAIGCLATIDGPGAAEHLVPLCDDREIAVRCAAFDGLGLIRSESAVAPAVAHISDDSWQVRASAIHALGRIRHRDSIGPLIARMAQEDGRLVRDIGFALADITGRDPNLGLAGWQRFWDRYGETFVLPTDAELEVLRARQEENRQAYQGAGSSAADFVGLETPSRSIVFVVDVSGSMEQEMSERERYSGDEYPSLVRMEIVKAELTKTIRGLGPNVRFNIFAFASEVRPWKKKLVKANPLSRSSAATFIERLEPIGGVSKEGLATAGLTGSANLDAGKTNTYAALMAALQVDEKRRDKYAVDADTIYFLSDGRPSVGRLIDTDDILAAVRRENQLRRVVINTLAIGEFRKDFMRELAWENGGEFVDLGK